MRRAGWLALLVVGALLLAVGTIAGVANRQVLNGPRFARHVDNVRLDGDVSREIGVAITDEILRAEPNLTALRPLVLASATSLVGSDAFGAVFRGAVERLHDSLTRPGGGRIVLQLADVGALLAGVLRSVAPEAAAHLPDNLDVSLAHIGDQSFADRTISLAHRVQLLSWLLPLLAVLALAGAFLLDWRGRRGRVGLRSVGLAVLCAGLVVMLGVVISSVVGSYQNTDTLDGALWAAGLSEVAGMLRTPALALLLAGGALMVVGAVGSPEQPLLRAGRWRQWLAARPDSAAIQAGRAAVLVIVGGWVVFRPQAALQVVAVLVGLAVLLVGVVEGGRVLMRERGQFDTVARAVGVRLLRGALVVVTVGGLVVWLVVMALPDSSSVSAGDAVSAKASGACNGYAQLCDRAYDDVAFPATHNSMSAANQPGWFLAEQPDGIVDQLNAGIRALLIDTWYGQATTSPGRVATEIGQYDEALQAATTEYGSAAVQSALRLAGSVTPARVGKPEPYLCHGICEIGATKWEPVMADVRAWLAAHPREVVTFFIEDNVSPADTAAVFAQAGLDPYVYTPTAGQPWPTLGQMIDSGRRVVVLMQRRGGGSTYPWLLQGWDWAQDTNYDARTTQQLSCARNRGSAGNPLVLVNNWINNFDSIVSDARKVNADPFLSTRLTRCEQQFGKIPNYVAVNFYNQGDLFPAVKQLNGLG